MIRVVPNLGAPARCALCHDQLGAASRLACGACASVVHDDCGRELARCPTLGCAGTLATSAQLVLLLRSRRASTTLPPPPRRVRGWSFFLWILWPLLVPHVWVGLALLVGLVRGGGVPAFFALLWNAILVVFLHHMWWPRVRTRLLLKYGQACPGTITQARTETGRSTTYHATFRFVDPATRRSIEQSMALRAEDYAAALSRARDRVQVTVLFDPRRPRRAVVYEVCGEVVE